MRFEWPFFACHNSEVVCTQTKLWRWKQKLLVLIMTVTICYKHQVFVLVITIIFIIIDVSKVLPMLHSLFTTYRNDRVSMEGFLLRLTVNRLMHFCCDQKKIFTVIFFYDLRLKFVPENFAWPLNSFAGLRLTVYPIVTLKRESASKVSVQELFEKSGSYFRATILADSCLHRKRARNKWTSPLVSPTNWEPVRRLSWSHQLNQTKVALACSRFSVKKDARKSGSAKDLVFTLDNRSCRVHLPAIFRAPTLLLVFFDWKPDTISDFSGVITSVFAT